MVMFEIGMDVIEQDVNENLLMMLLMVREMDLILKFYLQVILQLKVMNHFLLMIYL